MNLKDDAQEIVGLLQDVQVLCPQDARRVEFALRERFGGQKLRISERPPVTLADIDAGLRARKPVRVIAEEVGLSRATVYRMLNNRKFSKRAKSEAVQPVESR